MEEVLMAPWSAWGSQEIPGIMGFIQVKEELRDVWQPLGRSSLPATVQPTQLSVVAVNRMVPSRPLTGGHGRIIRKAIENSG